MRPLSLLLALITAGCGTAPLGAAGSWRLTGCNQNGWGCEVVSRHETSGECQAARRAYLAENPDRTAVCLN